MGRDERGPEVTAVFAGHATLKQMSEGLLDGSEQLRNACREILAHTGQLLKIFRLTDEEPEASHDSKHAASRVSLNTPTTRPSRILRLSKTDLVCLKDLFRDCIAMAEVFCSSSTSTGCQTAVSLLSAVRPARWARVVIAMRCSPASNTCRGGEVRFMFAPTEKFSITVWTAQYL